MKTWIINLKKDAERRAHMAQICKKYDLDYEFVDAVYGKALTDTQIEDQFDRTLSYKRYGRVLNLGEIGCTLSHYKCYQNLLKSNEPYVLILEDDITIVGEMSVLPQCANLLNSEDPIILFLSGDYWWYRKKNVNGVCVTNVFDAVGSYAYLINRAAARLIIKLNTPPSCVADHWSLYRAQGIELKAIFPYVIDANIVSFSSTIKQETFGENRTNMSIKMLIPAYWNAFVKKILLKTGRFVSKIRK